MHLSSDAATATKVGSRHGKPVLYIVKTKDMYDDGYSFFLSKNGAWLTKEVPVKYLITEQIGTFRKGEYCRVCELLEKTIYGEEELEEYEKRTLNRFMKKLTVPGEKCNLKMRMNLRYACFKFLGM